MQIDHRLIEKAQRNDRLAQKQLYDQYAPALLSVCRLYINDLQFAEDALLKAFFKIFLIIALNQVSCFSIHLIIFFSINSLSLD